MIDTKNTKYIMNQISCKKYKTYVIGSSLKLTNRHLRELTLLLNIPPAHQDAVLEGRASVTAGQLEEIGPVIVKHYRRGGLLGFLIKKTYWKTGKTRCRIEYEQLENARAIGISAPEPIAYAYKGRMFYNGWLITREIEDQQSLAKLSRSDETRTYIAAKNLIHQVLILIDHQIYHADFHPGNILVNKDNQVFVIDFDNARYYRGKRRKLCEKYLRRWKRAIVKHRLPYMLYEIMDNGLHPK